MVIGNIRDVLLSDEQTAGLYVVFVKEGTIDELHIDAFAQKSYWTNSDWVIDYVRTFVSKCYGEFAIYYVGYNDDNQLSVWRVRKGKIGSDEFQKFADMSPYVFYREYYDDWKELTEDYMEACDWLNYYRNSPKWRLHDVDKETIAFLRNNGIDVLELLERK